MLRVLILLMVCIETLGFRSPGSMARFGGSVKKTTRSESPRQASLQMFDIELSGPVYAGIFALTLIPSLAFVKFVGDAADNSKESITDEQKQAFKSRMMDTNRGFVSFGVPSTEEELLQKAITKAYMQDKDVDVAVLEQKLKQRAEWRKEMMQEAKIAAAEEDEDGW